MPPRSSAATRGFTLVEMMVTVAIAGIMLALAAPAMQQFVTQKAVSSSSDELVSALRFARSEALKRSSPVSVCGGNGGTTATTAACTSNDWTKGWIIFADRDGNGVYSYSSSNPTDELLRVQQAVPQQVVGPTPTGTTAYVEFVATGMALGAKSFTFRPNLNSSNANFNKFSRIVCVNSQGRTNVVSGTGTCN